MKWSDLPQRWKPWLDLLQSVGTIVALVAGAYWFYLQRSTVPQIRLEQIVTQRPLAGADDRTLITVEVRTTNVGKVKVDLTGGTMDIHQLNPTGRRDPFTMVQLGDLTLEPGETDQSLFQTFVFVNSVKTIQVHSAYKVPASKEMYWNLYSPVDLGEKAAGKETASTTVAQR
ncbi:hypothetical protein [Terriglobus aquaticus]|uniref:Uncharacterized protein n=1 Tax=Terriglobus aquaticus TaxID=940139 RepID=A0ABW9KGK5_9BACT|nr:hypothetical protein [Terriglobus aquaticus]